MHYFLRHGESAANAGGYAAGQLDVELTERGYTQANSAGLSIVNSSLTIDMIISSELKRAHQTALAVADLIGHDPGAIVTTGLLNERKI